MKQSYLLLALFLLPFISAGQDFQGMKKINGTSLYVTIKGKGEPLVIIHGGPGLNQSYFNPHLNALAKKYKLVFYDQRASGKSLTPSPDSITMDFFAEDIEAIRKDLGVGKINLFAHSWGALPAVAYAIRHADQVNKMILCNPVPLSKEFDKEMIQNIRNKASNKDSTDRSIILGSKGFRSGDADAYKKLLILAFRHSFYDPANYPKLQLELPQNYKTASQALMTGLGGEMSEYDFYDATKAFNFPILIIHGSVDAVPLGADTKAQARMPKSSLVVFSKSGHFAFIDQPGKFNSTVKEFLGGR